MIARLEAAKQENFTRETLEVWFSEMQRLGWTEEKMVERTTAVMRGTTYGKVTFDSFVNAEQLYTRREAIELANSIIEARRRTLLEAHVDDAEIERKGLTSIQDAYGRRMDAVRQRIGATLELRTRKAERFIKAAPEETKEEIKAILIDRGLLKYSDDPSWRQILHFFAPHILKDVEAMMNRMGGTNQ